MVICLQVRRLTSGAQSASLCASRLFATAMVVLLQTADVLQGERTITDLCQLYGISRKTGNK